MMGEEEVKGIVDKAKGFSERGHNPAALQLLREALDEANFWSLSDKEVGLRKGLIYHCRGIIEQTMGDYDEAIVSLAIALGFRKDIPVDRAYTIFQLFDCKINGEIPISHAEKEETEKALAMAIIDDAATRADIGIFFQNVAYIEQVKGNAEKAILFYEMALNVQRKAGGDDKGAALIWAKLAECWKEIGDQGKAKMYAEAVSKFFKDTGDGKVKRQLGGWFGWDW